MRIELEQREKKMSCGHFWSFGRIGNAKKLDYEGLRINSKQGNAMEFEFYSAY